MLYFSLCAEKQGKCSNLLLFYVGIGTFKKRCSFNEFASVHRDYILKRAIVQLTIVQLYHTFQPMTFFEEITHLEEKQQLNDISFFTKRKIYNR